MSDQRPIRTRFAPSPTGELHLGSARTALHAYLFARHSNGQINLRIEDTDQKRFVPGSMDRFLGDFAWLGIRFDGEPVIQSSRAERHREVARELVTRGAAYYEASSEHEHGQKRSPDEYRQGRAVYRGATRELTDQPDGPFVIRLKVPAGTLVLQDLVRGRIEFDLATVDDQVLLKSDGMATYHLAAMVDDHDIEISHIIRSEEWLPSSPKHLLIFQAMGWDVPQFAHLPVILAPDGKKLSKRLHGDAVWISTYRAAGYLPEALVNYLALLGWNPGGEREYFSLDDLVAAFSLERVHKAGAKFDQVKLDAFQQHFVQQLSDDELATKLSEYLEEQSLPKPAEPQFGRLIQVLHNRLGRFDEFLALAGWVKSVAAYSVEQLVFRKSTVEATKQGLRAATMTIETADPAVWESVEQLSEQLVTIVREQSLTNGDVFWPVRMALTGLEHSPSPAECLWVLGRDESLRRLEQASEKLPA